MSLLSEVWPQYTQSLQDPFQSIIPTQEETQTSQTNKPINKPTIQSKREKKIKQVEHFSESEHLSENEYDSDNESVNIPKKTKKKRPATTTDMRNVPVEHFAYQGHNNLIPPHVLERNRREFNIGSDLDLDFPKSRILLLGCGVFLLYAFDALRK